METRSSDFCRLILIRHPELAARHDAVGSGSAELSRRGRASVLRWLQFFEPVPIDRVCSAEQKQCSEPAAALATHLGVEMTTDPRLDDQDMGEWQGRSWEELLHEDNARVRDFFSNLGESQPPGGESLGAAVERLLAWWTGLAPSSAGKTLAVVLPGSLLAGFTAAMLGMRLSRSMSLSLPHSGIGVLDVFANGVRLQSWNPDGLGADANASPSGAG